jgi:hypothetical protein
MAANSDKTLKIILHRKGSPDERTGTFTGPAPKMKIAAGDGVSFSLQVTPNDSTATFEVTFPATPFTSDDTVNGTLLFSVNNSNAHRAVFAGLFHYQVSVTTVDGTYSINNCPELDIDPG